MNDRDELNQLWRSQPIGPETKGEDMLTIAMRKARRFDRMITVRNAAECLAAAVVTVLFTTMAVHTSNALIRAGNAVVAASGVWIIFYMLRFGREASNPAPDQSLRGFQHALLQKYEHQIQLLKNVKYWYLPPLYAGLLLASAGSIRENAAKGRPTWAEFVAPVIYTAVFAGVWWLNETKGVGYFQ